MKKIRTRNKIFIAVAIFLFIFIVSMIVIFCVKDAVPDTLIQCVLGTGGLMEAMTGAITIAEFFTGKKKNTDESQ